MIRQNKRKITSLVGRDSASGLVRDYHVEPPSGYDGDALGRGWNHRWNRRKGAGGLWSAASVFAGASVLPVADPSRSGKAAAEPEGSGDDVLDLACVLACDERHFVSGGFGEKSWGLRCLCRYCSASCFCGSAIIFQSSGETGRLASRFRGRLETRKTGTGRTALPERSGSAEGCFFLCPRFCRFRRWSG